MNCNKCGFPLTGTDQFCHNCGAPINTQTIPVNPLPQATSSKFNNPNLKKILIIAGIGLLIVLVAIGLIIKFNNSKPILGNWSCKSFDGSYQGNDFVVTMNLNKDNTFLWGQYGHEDNNYVKGSYTFEDLHKSNYSGNYKYYTITLTGDEYVIDGEKQNELYKSTYEMGIINKNDKKEAIIYNAATYSMYYCYTN